MSREFLKRNKSCVHNHYLFCLRYKVFIIKLDVYDIVTPNSIEVLNVTSSQCSYKLSYHLQHLTGDCAHVIASLLKPCFSFYDIRLYLYFCLCIVLGFRSTSIYNV